MGKRPVARARLAGWLAIATAFGGVIRVRVSRPGLVVRQGRPTPVGWIPYEIVSELRLQPGRC